MLLAIDTATRTISLALSDGQSILAETTWRTANHHTIELAPALHDMLARAGVKPADLTALAVTRGPGSYAGLRIGMSLAKGLSLAASPPLPIVAISTLDVTAAAQPHLADHLYAVAQAGRQRINVGTYDWAMEGGWHPQGEPFITTWEKMLLSVDKKIQVAGEIDAAGYNLLTDHPAVIAASPGMGLRRAGFLAEIAFHQLASGAAADPATAAPIYLT
jgi:tRNA threonylcarbamoyladenosine biosynthesis protein TsaB